MSVPPDNPLGLPIEWLGEGPRYIIADRPLGKRARWVVLDAARNGLSLCNHDSFAEAEADARRRNSSETGTR